MGSSDQEAAHPRRAARVSVVAVTALTTFGAAIVAASPAVAAQEAEVLAQPAASAMTLGVLGPVGLVAIALGVVGMVAGVVRQRRKKAREVPASAGADGADTSSGSQPDSAEPAGSPQATVEVATIALDLDPAAVRPPGPRAAADGVRARATVE